MENDGVLGAMSEKNRTGTENWLTTECPDTKENSTGQFHLVFLKFLLPFIVIVACASTLIYFAMKKRRLDQLRHRLVPFYKFEPGDGEDEWQTELLEESDNQRSFTRLQDYRSTGSVASDYQNEKYF